MKNKEIKFRVPILNDKGEVWHWHYWGFIDSKFIQRKGKWSGMKMGDDEQSTGLTDKNGKEIYEGDILLGRFDVREVEDWLWLNLTEKQKETGQMLFEVRIPEIYQIVVPDDIEIIGNISENKDLLKN